MKDNFISWEDAVLWLRDQPDQHELVRACYYDDPLLDTAERFYLSNEWQAVKNYLPPVPGKALDLGAGRGISAYALAKDGWDTVALEPDKSNVVGTGAIKSLMSKSNLQVEVVEEWGEELPFSNESFDLVYCRQVLHHAKDLNKLCREIWRVLTQKGTFIATREHVISKKEDLPVFLENHPLHHLYGGENAYLLKEYISSITQAGLQLTKILNPFNSDINLYPNTVADIKERITRRIKLPISRIIPNNLINLLGDNIRTPGRLYSFIGRKP